MRWRALAAALALLLAAGAARADAVATLREFIRDVHSGSASFTQTMTSPDGARQKTASGSFEFLRPDRFRFVYRKPFEQQIVADGSKVWLYDIDLNQVTVRSLSQALGATPAALLSGSAPDRDFVLSDAPSRDGLDWVLALPRAKDGPIRSLRVGFRGNTLAALEIVDAFGKQSLLRFSDGVSNPPLAEEHFRFVVPPGVDLIQP